jgi:PAS domain S-box-containing protein
MADTKALPPGLSDLRQRAEEQLQAEAAITEELSSTEATRLIHELRVHQIELEMQNEELRQAQVRLEESRSKYADLYDFAPVGYLTLDDQGKILEANLTATTFLRVERRLLLGQFFPLFLVESDRKDFRQLLIGLNQREWQGEFHFHDTSGNVRTMLLDILCLQDREGRKHRRLALTDITKLKKTQEALEESQEKLSQLNARFLAAQELERQRISRDLHDDLGQSLMVLKMQLNAVKKSFKRGQQTWDEFDRVIDFVNVIADQVRVITRALRPSVLENLGLGKALAQLLADFEKYQKIQVSQEMDDVGDLLSPEAQVTVYRIFQECLTNATKHGKATSMQVRLKKNDGVVCIICTDNGIGLDLSDGGREQGLGLAAMEERVRLLQGSFEITSEKGKGTRIAITLPLDKNQV